MKTLASRKFLQNGSERWSPSLFVRKVENCSIRNWENDHRIIRGVEFTTIPELLPLTCVITMRVGELRSNVYFQTFWVKIHIGEIEKRRGSHVLFEVPNPLSILSRKPSFYKVRTILNVKWKYKKWAQLCFKSTQLYALWIVL